MLPQHFQIPILLRSLVESGRWKHPGDDLLQRAIPKLVDPVDFCSWLPASTISTDIESSFTPQDCVTFKLYRDGQPERILPWLNADKSVFIAVNRIPGDDVAIALDYRDSNDTPIVVASCWADNKYHEWFKVADSFDLFARSLGLTTA